MNKAIEEDFNYRNELECLFDVPVDVVLNLISNHDRFAGIYHKETILDPEYEFDDEIKEQVKNPISSDSVWFELESGHAREIGNDYDLAYYYDNNRRRCWKSIDNVKDDILDNYIYDCQRRSHDGSLGCDITELYNDGVKEYLEQRNLTIDNCSIIGDINDFNDNNCCCSWFLIECQDGEIYIYQDWDQVWENIIFDLFPEEWLKEFASK